MQILFVSRDNGGAKQSVPTALEALKKKYKIGMVVEGLAADRFQEAGLFSQESKAKLIFKGSEDLADIPFSLDADAVIKKFQPDVVVITRSIPNSLESSFGIAANKAGIPLVLMEDYWGGHNSSKATPDSIITIDEYAQELAKLAYPKAQVIIAGNPTVIDFDLRYIPDEVKYNVQDFRSRFGRVFVFAGGDPEQMTEELSLLIKCLKLTNDWCLISRPHPTITGKDKEPGLKWGDFWNDMLNQFGERIVSVECRLGDYLAILCDATFSGFSMMLNTAAYARRAAISLDTKKGRELICSAGLSDIPIVVLGCARRLTFPCDLDSAGFIQPVSEDILAKLKPFDPSVALEVIEDFIRK